MKHALVVVVSLAAALSLAGCGSSSKSPAAADATTTSLQETTTSPTTAASTVNINMHAKGSINGVDFDGPVIGSTLRCIPSTESHVQVTWGGTITVKGKGEQIAGDMYLKIGGNAFPSDGTASLVLGGDYQHRVGATAGTATAGSKSGTINAQYAAGSDEASLQGTWRCT